ncbi:MULTISPECIES: carbohydrate ABC transporter permease [Microbacterium]|jgi:multiple sugar transport system permease protein|uniref:Sugar ABC transporter permease n=1 Tax=Microbacterium testaceum TaxID=2033 RepID=A0A147F9I9_MICTE|nr:sugar ABC transporter permease [Microbacterium testaceum]MDF2508931.1 sugar transporter permease [Microbacterium sp.]KTS04455.1 sugar ABC transporter permease [Microbacterium testaceum]KTS13234.1 sugar ABC transporter permease [Microbacterium testaceum]KTS65720.1 sugar ABC transporter permease [Microbacterium testaceum]KTS85891.1 sugar ABC transporter permease [Microbacterium testaceum]
MTMRTLTPPDTEVIVTGRPASRRTRQLRKAGEAYAFLSPTLVLLFVLMIVPIVMVIGYSFQDNVILNKSPEVVGLDNYVAILTDSGFWKATGNTLFFTLTSVAAHLVLGLSFALLLNSRLVGAVPRAIFRGLYVLPWLFTVAVIAVLWRMLLAPNGIVNFLLNTDIEWLASPQLALGTVTFINIWAGYPFFMVSLLAGLQGIPSDLYEAATVDGANPVQRFWNVTVPQLRPIIVSLVLLDLIWTSQQFALIWLTTGGGPIDVTEMLSTFTYKLAFAKYDFSMASTSAVLVLAMSMIIAVLYVRHQKARD